ncbi:MAG: Rab family GTPase [Candidatus Hermodarchaeota archaeon]
MKVPEEDIYYGFKIILIGAPGVGKTCLFNRYCFNSFNLKTKMTLGISFHSTYLRIKFPNASNKKDGYVVNSIFDFGGQERFRPMIPKFLEGTNGALLVFDSVSFSSFQQLDYWNNILVDNIGNNNIPIILVASKCDLLEKTTKAEIVSNEVINEFIETKKFDGFFRTSALNNFHILEVFKELTALMLERHNCGATLV